MERLLPDNVKPQSILTEMEIKPYIPPSANSTKTRNTPANGTKRKRNNDINRNIPLGAMSGFVTASKLRPKAKKAKKVVDHYAQGIDDDSDDAEICAGPLAAVSKTKGSKGKITKRASRSKARRKQTQKSIPNSLEDDDDDMDIEAGIPRLKGIKNNGPGFLSDSSDLETSTPRVQKGKQQLIDLPSTPVLDLDPTQDDDLPVSSGAKTAPASSSPKHMDNQKWLFGLSDSEDDRKRSSTSKAKASFKPIRTGTRSRSTETQPKGPPLPPSLPPPAVEGISKPLLKVNKVARLTRDRYMNDKSDDTTLVPEPTFAVGRPAKRKPLVAPPSSPAAVVADNVPPRIVRRDSPALMPPPPNPPVPKSKKPELKMTSNPALFDIEAEHSGEDASEGESDVDMVESESDRWFLEEPEETQVSPSYNQTAAYRMGMMTQAPANLNGPQFRTRARRTGPFAGGKTQVPKPADWSSSPTRESEPNEYEMGSFVVHDDDMILYENSSEP